jgi:hypothetical protein
MVAPSETKSKNLLDRPGSTGYIMKERAATALQVSQQAITGVSHGFRLCYLPFHRPRHP